MGYTFYLEARSGHSFPNFECNSELVNYEIEVKKKFTDEEAKQILELQDQAKSEISEKIESLTLKGLTGDFVPIVQDNNFYCCIAKLDNIIVGYCFGHFDKDAIQKRIVKYYYISVVYILPFHRGKKLSVNLIKELICKILNEIKLEDSILFKAVTKNTSMIKILQGLDFSDKIPSGYP